MRRLDWPQYWRSCPTSTVRTLAPTKLRVRSAFEAVVTEPRCAAMKGVKMRTEPRTWTIRFMKVAFTRRRQTGYGATLVRAITAAATAASKDGVACRIWREP